MLVCDGDVLDCEGVAIMYDGVVLVCNGVVMECEGLVMLFVCVCGVKKTVIEGFFSLHIYILN